MPPRKVTIDDPDDEVLPASPRRRRAAAMIGCLFALFLMLVLVWFAATHTQTLDSPGWFGS